MRPLLATTAFALLALSLPAVAQQGAGWVDPPAKAAETPARADVKPAAKPAAEPAPAAPSEAAAPARRETRSATIDEPQAAPRKARGARRAGEERQARRQAAREAAAREAGGRATRSARVAPPVFTAPPRETPGMARSESDPRFAEWAGTAQRLSEAYLDSVSSPGDGMAAAAPRFYGAKVRFHGRTMSLTALMAEKRRFARRWPERRYEPQGEPRVSCNAATQSCLVRTVHDFTAASPGRGARSQGVGELMLTVGFASGRPVIVEESSRVLRRGTLSASVGGRGGA